MTLPHLVKRSLTAIFAIADNGFMKFFLAFTLCLFSLNSLLAESVYDSDQDSGVNVTLYSNSGSASFNLFEETSSSTGTGRTHNVYVPMGTSTTDNRNFSYYSNRANLPLVSSETISSGVSYLSFKLTTDTSSTYPYLYVAVSDDSSPTTFTVVGNSNYTQPGDSAFTYNLDFNTICDIDDDIFDCGTFEQTSDPSDEDYVTFLFFLSGSDGLTTSSTISTSDLESDGIGYVAYKVYFSNRIYDDSIVYLNSLSKEDGQLVASVDGFSMGDYFDSAFALADSSTCTTDTTANQTMGSLGKSLGNLTDLETTDYDGEFKIKNLTNGTCYSVRIFLCDKFGFCSYASDQLAESPEEIEALLEEQACFFFTAGFGGEHYVVKYFQEFRDQVLRRFSLGRAFISWYYKTAPQYTPYILQRPWMQKSLKTLGYILYGVIKGWWVLLIAIMTLIISLSGLAIVQSRKRFQKL